MLTFTIRGATVANENTEAAILDAARELLSEIARANNLTPREILSILFTLTADLDAAFPTRAARELGWTHVALLDMQQARVQGDLARCIRVLLLIETERELKVVRHIYLRAARSLRPDLAS